MPEVWHNSRLDNWMFTLSLKEGFLSHQKLQWPSPEVTNQCCWGFPAHGQEYLCPCFVTRLLHRHWSCFLAQLDSPLASSVQQLGHHIGAFTLPFPLSRLGGRAVLWAIGTHQCHLCPVFPEMGSSARFPWLNCKRILLFDVMCCSASAQKWLCHWWAQWAFGEAGYRVECLWVSGFGGL